MRTSPFLLIALVLAGQAYANMIPLSGVRSVSASGIAGRISGGGQSSYSETQSLSGPLGTFNGNVGGSADRTDLLPVPEFYGHMGSYHADSRASQTSTITADEISVSASLGGSTMVSWAGPYGPADSWASSIFEVSFNVSTPLEYQLAVSRSFGYHDMPFPHFEFFLSSTNYGKILDNFSLSSPLFFPGPFSGILLPGAYTLRFNADIYAVADPHGDFKLADYSMNLRVAPVPDAGSTLTLLGLALCAIGGISRKLNLA
jgi:VPDSG-CTERM motif